MRSVKRVFLVGVLVALALGLTQGVPGSIPTAAAVPPARNFIAVLDGAQENPPVATDARGTATFQLNLPETRLRFVLTISQITNVFASRISLTALPTAAMIEAIIKYAMK